MTRPALRTLPIENTGAVVRVSFLTGSNHSALSLLPVSVMTLGSCENDMTSSSPMIGRLAKS
ncbi:hypothetical protein RLIN73S_02818 [Rhodanobacter lindaniclasticus]